MARTREDILADLERLQVYSDGQHGKIDPAWYGAEEELLLMELARCDNTPAPV